MNEKIYQSLHKKFYEQQKRIVFWYDPDRELRDDFLAFELEGVSKIELDNNEFAVKHRILREEPEQQFLIYHEGAKPANRDNWLLDVLLAHEVFSTDQVSIFLADLELSSDKRHLIEAHLDFFNSKQRLSELKELVTVEDADDTILMKMLAVCAKSEARLEEILKSLLADLANGRDDKISLCERFGLAPFLWQQVSIAYGYHNEEATVKDFAVKLFEASYAIELAESSALTPPALVFLKNWKDNTRHADNFRILAQKYEKLLKIEQDLADRQLRDIAKIDFFRVIDKVIVIRLVNQVHERVIKARDCEDIIRKRENTYWFKEFANLYRAIEYAVNFLDRLDTVDLTIETPSEGIQSYTKTWFKIDQLYRKYMVNASKSMASQAHDLLDKLNHKIENLYSNDFLLKLGDNWQVHVDQLDQWLIPSVKKQWEFYYDYLRLYVEANRRKKIYVVISDALRYEIGEELVGLIRSEDRYDADVEAMLSTLPSYTQLGMAALLPHKTLRNDPSNGKNVVYVDDKDSRGTKNRSQILEQINGVAIQAEELLKLTTPESRDFVKLYDVVYVYHNVIDNIGDKRATENETFDAVERAFSEILDIIRKLTNANASNILITADHGFLYQQSKIEESDYISDQPRRGVDVTIDRRFVIGKTLDEHPSYKKFTAAQLGIAGEFDVQIPKSINRLRQSGSGSRYVHGGASLQEILVPVLVVNKKRESDTRKVKVSIIRGSNTKITTGQLVVKLYQNEAVTDKVQAITLQVGLFTKDGTLISNREEISFNLTTEVVREREQTVVLRLSREANQLKNQAVYVRLHETEEGTSHQSLYEDAEYLLNRSITSDFDF